VAPQEVVVQLLRRRLLKAEDLATLGVDAGHHVLDGAIFASRVHGLEHHEHCVAIVRPQTFLRLRKALEVLLQDVLGAGFDDVLAERLHLFSLGLAVVVAPQSDPFSEWDAKQSDDVLPKHDRCPLRHFDQQVLFGPGGGPGKVCPGACPWSW
jgi:hypothetical protein